MENQDLKAQLRRDGNRPPQVGMRSIPRGQRDGGFQWMKVVAHERDRCRRWGAFASEWDVHVSFGLGQILCPQCYVRLGSWRHAELTSREAELLRAGIHPFA
jgi:hypothetical protein